LNCDDAPTPPPFDTSRVGYVSDDAAKPVRSL
jgi:hypothetical protein